MIRLNISDDSCGLLFNKHSISFDLNLYYISTSDHRDYRAKVNTLVDKFCQIFHMHPIS